MKLTEIICGLRLTSVSLTSKKRIRSGGIEDMTNYRQG